MEVEWREELLTAPSVSHSRSGCPDSQNQFGSGYAGSGQQDKIIVMLRLTALARPAHWQPM